MKKLVAENDALSEEVGRLKHVTQLRSGLTSALGQAVTSQTSHRTGASVPNPMKSGETCWNCGETGYYAKDCRRQHEGMHSIQSTGRPKMQPQPGTTTGYRIARTSTGPNESKCRATYLRANIDGRICDCLLGE